MRAFIRNTTAAERARREENGQGGFSLIELIIVVVILGILAAVAIPIFLGLQDQAKQSALDTVAANAASQVAVQIAKDDEATPDVSNLEKDGIELEVNFTSATDKLGTLCVEATQDGMESSSGPGCTP